MSPELLNDNDSGPNGVWMCFMSINEKCIMTGIWSILFEVKDIKLKNECKKMA